MLNSEKIVVHSFSEIDDHVTQHMKIISLVSRNAEQDGMMETLDRRNTTLETDTAHLKVQVANILADNVSLRADNVYLSDRLLAVEGENILLRTDIVSLRADNVSLRADNVYLTDRLLAVEGENILLRTDIVSLRADNVYLTDRLLAVEGENILLRTDIVSLRADNVYLTDRLLAVESRDTPITIREAMRKLERFLCLEAAGSKNRFRMFYNINKINTSTEIQIQSDWNGVLQRRNLRAEHIVALEFLKDCGDEMTHDQRPALSKSLWSTLLQTALSEGEDEDESNLQLSQGLLSALEHYIPCPSSDEPWVINGR